jgi:hypothetical protein
MSGYLTLLSGFAVMLTLVILVLLFKKKDFREIMKYCTMGLLVAFIDIVVEYLGTSTGHWTYNESVYFILDLIPIELVFLFFSAGVVLRFIFINLNKIKIPVKANAIFYILILIVFLVYVRGIYLEPSSNMMPLAILLGLWGISNISDRNKEGVLILAILATVLDLIVELIIVSSGSYSYKDGFSLSIPIIYGLYTIALLAVMEKLHKLDKLLDHPFVKNLLKLFGVYRKRYKKELTKVKKRIRKEIKNGTKTFNSH